MTSDDGPLPRSNLNFFFTLDAILNSPTLTEAARQASLTQPAISMALKKARAHYGDEIVSYVGGRRELTALAVALRPQVRRILREAKQVFDYSLAFDPITDRRTVRLTMPDFVEVTFMPHVLAAVRTAAPLVTVETLAFDYRSAEHHFERDIDFALVPAPLKSPGLRSLVLYDDELSAMVASSHPAALTGVMTSADYAGGRHAALFDAADIFAPNAGAAADLLRSRSIAARTSVYAALPTMILDTDLIVTTSARHAQYCASIMDLVPVAFPIKVGPIDMVLHWQPFRSDEPLMVWMQSVLETAGHKIARHKSG